MNQSSTPTYPPILGWAGVRLTPIWCTGVLLLLAGAAHAQSPVVTSLTPVRNARAASPSTRVAVNFSQALNNAAGQQAFTVFSQQTGKKAGAVSVRGNTLNFDPNTDFKPGETVYATATAATRGNNGVAVTPHVFQFTTAVTPSAATFSGGAEISVGRGPRRAKLGDVDGDGDLDLLTATSLGSTGAVSIRLNDGKASFSSGADVALSEGPQDLALGDLDGDGDLDFVTIGGTTARVSLNNGTGRFTTGPATALGSGLALSVALGDVDADGDLDLVTVRSLNGVSVRLNDGNGTFSSAQNLQTGFNPQEVVLGDIDSDGDLDLLTANNLYGSASTVGVRVNDGDGNFSGTWEYPVGMGAMSLTLGDVNGDGDLDLLTANGSSNTVSVRLNDSKGVFKNAPDIAVGIRPTNVTVGDLDGDGDLDLLTTNNNFTNGATQAGTVSVRLNNGSGTFSGNQEVDTKVVGPSYAALGDLDGDGDLDFATANADFEDGKVTVRLNQPTTTPLAVTSVSPTRNARAASKATEISVSFNQDLSDTPNTQQALKVFGQQAGGKKNGNVKVNGNTLSFKSNADFRAGETISATLIATARGNSGAALAKPQVFQFTTATSPSAGTFGAGSEVSIVGVPYAVSSGLTTGDVDGDGNPDLLTSNPLNDQVSVRLNDGKGGFGGTQEVSVGNRPENIVLGDVDGDGDLDLVVVNQGSTANNFAGTVSVRLNDGKGGFTGTQDVSVGRAPYDVTLGDVDADGDLDFISSNGGNMTASVRLNDGTGTFTAGQEITIGVSPFAAVLGDIDGDGDLDLLAGNYYASTVATRLNNGDGTFSVGKTIIAGGRPAGLAVGDIDGDGDLDLLATALLGGVDVRVNDSDGNFSGTQVISGISNFSIGDIDGDGDLDVVGLGGGLNTASVRLNNGTGTFSIGQLVAVGAEPSALALSDVDGDGDLDVLTRSRNNSNNSVSVRLNQAASLQVVSTWPVRNINTAARSTDVAASFNQTLDNTPATRRAISVFSQQAGGKKEGTLTVTGNTLSFNPSEDLKAGETVFATVAATVQGKAAASLTTPQVFQFTTTTRIAPAVFRSGTESAVGTNPQGVTLGDVDGDGDLDILTANNLANSVATGTVSIRLNNGDGTYTDGQEVSVGRGPYSVKLADIDGDGDLDLLTPNSNVNSVSVRFNNGNGRFVGNQEVAVGNLPHDVALGDIDGDGDLDLLAANYTVANSVISSTVSVRLNNGNGIFSSYQEVSVGARPLTVTLGDVDNDGDLDFVTASSNGTTASVRLNNGTGTFSGTQEVLVGFTPAAATLADVDNDGDLDLLTTNYFNYANTSRYTSSTVSVRLNDGDGTFSGTQQISVGDGANSIALGDANGDKFLDLFVTNSLGKTVSLRLNDTKGTFLGMQQIAVGDEPTSLALGDLDDNGTLDLVVANYSSDDVSVRLNTLASVAERVLATAPAELIEQINVYPNPAHSAVRLLLPQAIAKQALQVSLLNALGQTVLERQFTTAQAVDGPELDLSTLTTGLYTVQMRTSAGLVTKRLMVE
ncbi:FG-GAP-like repeat-containing protein [Hymenobacter sp. GOD-10R]|uniref:FG-GAP-like repeat-containing protein n=1 Tax=Hymenobacter sp. GOD-10R TaxID=3093922 RepID=UPI002D76FDD3|nr:FG-GAP-like repeat-containing protein [Hymenobacter sp. GOD-10R]WRQ28434.1 FG-GAP-like repeat-containing protein [Hymenobacter sp. GOD-10R]